MKVDLTLQELDALRLIATKNVSCQGLAENLKVSRPTAARVVSSLRRKGFRVATRREQAHWSYEILPHTDTAVKNIIGMLGSKTPTDASTHHDEYIVEELEGKSRKSKKGLKRGA